MKTFLRWIAGFFEDQTGSGSSKRLMFFIVGYFFYMQVSASVEGKLGNLEINQYVFFGTIVTLLLLGGYITSEFITKFWGESTLKSGNLKKDDNIPDDPPIPPRP